MYLPETEKIEWQMATLPKGYELVKEGPVLAGDIRWNQITDSWNLQDPTTSPRHDLIIGDPVKECSGICRQILTA